MPQFPAFDALVDRLELEGCRLELTVCGEQRTGRGDVFWELEALRVRDRAGKIRASRVIGSGGLEEAARALS